MSGHIVSTGTYVRVYVALMLLLIATTLIDYVNLGVFNSVISLTIAVVKMALVMLIFMHVRYMNRHNWLYVGAGLLWLSILLALTLGDYLTRVLMPGPFH
jgi:cytochrome c oxidase subunit IV